MYSIQVPNPRKRGRNPDNLVQAKRGCLQKQVTKENALHSHLGVPAVTHHEGESPSATVPTNTNNGTRTTEQPGSSNLGNDDELDD